MNVKDEVFKKFRDMLPSEISDRVVEKVVDECIDRLKRPLKEDPRILLDDAITVKINNGNYEGDIQLIDSREYGYNWIFSRKTGWLHTT